MKRKALLLCSVMVRGYGVAVVADEIAKRIGQFGWDLQVGCLSLDDNFASDNVHRLDPTVEQLTEFCLKHQIEVVVAQTSPYFECLPGLRSLVPTMVYEHGDPSPFFFDEDAGERESIRRNKIMNVYPNVSLVAASSYFLRHDIEWPNTKVCYLGADHIFSGNISPKTGNADPARPIRIGTLMRLGQGEARYKGNEIFIDLVGKLSEQVHVQPCLMGRGTESDRFDWEARGFEVHLNSPDDEKAAYLKSLDIFVSPSQWEGFNLPLVEAQAMGTLGLAFDVGAHPETTPILASSIDDALAMLVYWANHRDHLNEMSGLCQRFVSEKFRWEETARQFAELLKAACQVGPVGSPLTAADAHSGNTSRGLIYRGIRHLRRRGLRSALRTVLSRFSG